MLDLGHVEAIFIVYHGKQVDKLLVLFCASHAATILFMFVCTCMQIKQPGRISLLFLGQIIKLFVKLVNVCRIHVSHLCSCTRLPITITHTKLSHEWRTRSNWCLDSGSLLLYCTCSCTKTIRLHGHREISLACSG